MHHRDEQLAERFQVLLAETVDGPKVGPIAPRQHAQGHVLDQLGGHLARRKNTRRVGVDQHFDEHRRVVLYDLDTETRALCEELGLRAATVGLHPKFISMIRELIAERMEPNAARRVFGNLGPWHRSGPADCCPPPARVQCKE